MLTVEEAFHILEEEGMTHSIQMVRRWLREGRIQGTSTTYRKEGWRITESDLQAFIHSKKLNATQLQKMKQLEASVDRLTKENNMLQQQLFNITQSNITVSNIDNKDSIPMVDQKELNPQQIELLWNQVTKDLMESKEILDKVRVSLFRNLFSESKYHTTLFNPKFKRSYLCPFTNKKFMTAESLVKAAISWLVHFASMEQQRKLEKEEQQMIQEKHDRLRQRLKQEGKM